MCMYIRLSNGQDLGEPISIITIGTKKTGKVAACSQPLHTNRDWLPHWVDFYLSIGVSKIFMHAPQVKFLRLVGKIEFSTSFKHKILTCTAIFEGLASELTNTFEIGLVSPYE